MTSRDNFVKACREAKLTFGHVVDFLSNDMGPMAERVVRANIEAVYAAHRAMAVEFADERCARGDDPDPACGGWLTHRDCRTTLLRDCGLEETP